MGIDLPLIVFVVLAFAFFMFVPKVEPEEHAPQAKPHIHEINEPLVVGKKIPSHWFNILEYSPKQVHITKRNCAGNIKQYIYHGSVISTCNDIVLEIFTP